MEPPIIRGPITATSCLSTLTRRRRRSRPILELRLSKVAAGCSTIRAPTTCNFSRPSALLEPAVSGSAQPPPAPVTMSAIPLPLCSATHGRRSGVGIVDRAVEGLSPKPRSPRGLDSGMWPEAPRGPLPTRPIKVPAFERLGRVPERRDGFGRVEQASIVATPHGQGARATAATEGLGRTFGRRPQGPPDRMARDHRARGRSPRKRSRSRGSTTAD